MENSKESVFIPAHVYEILDSQTSMPFHKHPSLELIYVIDGRCHLEYGEISSPQYIDITSGQFVLVSPNVIHRWSSGYIHYIVLEFQPTNPDITTTEFFANSIFLRKFPNFSTLIQNANPVNLFNDSENIPYFLMHILNLLQKENNDTFTQTEYELCLQMLAVLILKCDSISNSLPPENIYIRKAMSYFETHYKDDFSVACLADFLQISIMHLERLFKATFNMTVMKKLNAFRIEKAQQLILSKNYSTKQLAQYVGYNNTKSFINNFKNITGVTVSEYKNTVAQHSTIKESLFYHHTRYFLS